MSPTVMRPDAPLGRTALLLAVFGAAGCSESAGPAYQPLVIQPALDAGDWQRGRAGRELPSPLRVVVMQGGRPVPGMAIQWTTDDGDIAGNGPTDADGVATARWTLPRREFYGLVARATTLSDSVVPPVTFHAASQFPALEVVGGNDQGATVGEVLPASLRVRVSWRGEPLAGETIRWSTNVEPQADRTDADGTATAIWRLGAVPGLKQAWARLDSDGPQVSFRATARCQDGGACVAYGPLAYVRNRNVYVSQVDGSDEILVAANATRPAWSPEGDQIAFVRDLVTGLQHQVQMCVGRPDGSGQRCVAGDFGVVAGGPSWSPDGDRVAFSVWLQGCSVSGCTWGTPSYSGLQVLHVADMQIEKFATHAMKSVSWSPDGRRIAFVGTAGGVGILKLDDLEHGYLNSASGSYLPFDVAWSPDGTSLALAVSDQSACPFDCDTAIATMAADGTGFRVVTFGLLSRLESVEWPGWSPDGGYVTFTRWDWDTPVITAVPVTLGPTELLVNGEQASWRR